MAYKFQIGAATLSGSLTQEGDILVKNGGDTTKGYISSSAGIRLSNPSAIIEADGASIQLNATDLRQIDDITAGTVAASKAVVVDASKDASGFRHITADGNITAGSSFIIGSADLDETDLEKLDGITNGTAAANKALVADVNGDIGAIRNLRTTGEIEAGSILSASTGLSLKGGATINGDGGAYSLSTADLKQIDGITAGAGAASKALVLNASRNINNINILTCSIISASEGHFAASTITVGGVAINAAEIGVLDSVTAGTVDASKAVVVDASKDISAFRNLTGVNLTATTALSGAALTVDEGGVTIGQVALTSTAAELNLLDGAVAGTVVAGKAVIYTDGGLVQGTDFKGPNGFDIGNAAVADFMKFNAAEIIVKDGALNFDIASHDSSNGLKLGGELVTSTAAELNLLDQAAATNNVASIAPILNASKGLDLVGGLTVDGALTVLGNASGDIVGISGSVQGNVLPITDKAYDLGSSAKKWKSIYASEIHADINISTGLMQVNGVASASFVVVSDGASTITLPTPVAGKQVIVKRDAVSSAVVKVSAAAGHLLEDGPFNYVELEENGAAVTCLAIDATMWMIV